MTQTARPYRSVLYIPGSKERALEKAMGLPADAIIFDLEDAVAPDEKPAARDLLARVLTDWDFGARARIVRVNGLDTEWGAADCTTMAAAIAAGAKIDAILIPKVNSPADLDAVAALVPGADLWAMMETCLGMLNAAQIAGHPRLKGMVMGTNDLAKELGSRFRADRLPMQAGLGLCLLAAKANGQVIVDGVYNAFKDEAGLKFECDQGRDMGFDGKTLIHPAQIDVCNTTFAPSEDEIVRARAVIEAFGLPENAGKGVIKVDGRMTELLHLDEAKRLVALADAIQGLSPA